MSKNYSKEIELSKSYLKTDYPDMCRLCGGEGIVQLEGPAPGQMLVETCSDCGGTGEKKREEKK